MSYYTRDTDHLSVAFELSVYNFCSSVAGWVDRRTFGQTHGRAPGYLADDVRLAGRGRPGSRSAASLSLIHI